MCVVALRHRLPRPGGGVAVRLHGGDGVVAGAHRVRGGRPLHPGGGARRAAGRRRLHVHRHQRPRGGAVLRQTHRPGIIVAAADGGDFLFLLL